LPRKANSDILERFGYASAKGNDKKELHVIKSAPHTFKDQEHLEEIKKIFLNWIKSIN